MRRRRKHVDTRELPLAPVVQRAADDVALRITCYDPRADREWTEVHYYRPGAAEYLLARYAEPMETSGLRWQVRLNEKKGLRGRQRENGEGLMGPYCDFCDHRCFVERRLPDDATWRPGETINMATCRKGMALDRITTGGYDYTTAINPRSDNKNGEK